MAKMKRFLQSILFCSSLFAINLEFGYNGLPLKDDKFLMLYSQLNKYTKNNNLISYRIYHLNEVLPFGSHDGITKDGKGIAFYFGKYDNNNKVLVSSSLGLEINYIKKKIFYSIPIKAEASMIIMKKIGLSTNLGYVWDGKIIGFGGGLNIKLQDIF